ncbi:MAG: hypothetical protein RBR87_16720 [Bacteroidales bacterium]|jgi:hypothetical protein|nr:hypothetical protein [Bacteroidales bacterium]
MKLTLETDNSGILESVKKIFKKQSKEDFWQAIPKNQDFRIKRTVKYLPI